VVGKGIQQSAGVRHVFEKAMDTGRQGIKNCRYRAFTFSTASTALLHQGRSSGEDIDFESVAVIKSTSSLCPTCCDTLSPAHAVVISFRRFHFYGFYAAL
jgi:hypothetical protein